MLWEYMERDGNRWREEDAKDDDQKEITYYVDNGELQTSAKGLRFRLTPNEDDVSPQDSVPFGTQVQGIPVGENWIRVGQKFLPMRLKGSTVLSSCSAKPVGSTSRCANTLRRCRQRTGRPGVFSSYLEEHTPVDQSHQNASPIFKNTVTKPIELSDPVFEDGTGFQYEAVHARVALRTEPDFEAPLQGCLWKGEQLELFDWDATWQWRKFQRPYDAQLKKADPSAWSVGWVRLHHDELGPLMRPLFMKIPSSIRMLPPRILMAHEGDFVSLQMHLLESSGDDGDDVDENVCGLTALSVASARGKLDCCVVLLQAGADPSVELAMGGGTAADRALDAPTLALIQSMDARLPEPKDGPLRDALCSLNKLTRPKATNLINSAEKQRTDARRRRLEFLRLEQEQLQRREDEEHRAAEQRQARENYRIRAEDVRRQEFARLQQQAQLAQEDERQEKLHRANLRASEGELYEVCAPCGIEVRAGPSHDAELVGVEQEGQILHLRGDWDATRRWLQCAGGAISGALSGWACIVDDDGEPLAIPA